MEPAFVPHTLDEGAGEHMLSHATGDITIFLLLCFTFYYYYLDRFTLDFCLPFNARTNMAYILGASMCGATLEVN